MKNVIFLISFLTALSSFSQKKNINTYKYIIVPTQFGFLSKPDQYQVNSLTKFLFNKNGFIAFSSNEKLPKDLIENRCLALTVNVKNNSGMFSTKNIIELKDCYNTIIYSSFEGKSKIKNYKKAYHEAIRNAFKSIKALKYKYNGKVEEVKQKEIPVVNNPSIKTVKPNKPITILGTNTLYAQKTANGFQLVNTKPEIVFIVLKSSKKDYYFIKDKNGVLFKKEGVWIAEFYENGKLIQKQYQIKF